MQKSKENDIGTLLSKMRQRQSNIRKSLDSDLFKLQYSGKTTATTAVLPSSTFENRLQRIRGIREKFENQYSTNNTYHKLTKNKKENMSLSLPLNKLKRPQSAKNYNTNNLVSKHTVSIANISHQTKRKYPLTSRDDIDIDIDINEEPENEVFSAKDVVLNSARSFVGDQESKQDIEEIFKNMQNEVSKQFTQKKRKQLIDSGKYIGNLSENLFFDIFLFLDAVTLSKMCSVSESWYHTILQSIRQMFCTVFKSYPSGKNKLPSKTIFLTLKKLHFIDSKSCAELLFWSCARGYYAFLNHFISNLDHNQPKNIILPPIRYSLNATSKIDNMTSLHIACKHNQLEIIKILLAHNSINVNKLTKSGKHAITIAAQRHNYDIVNALINHSKLNVNQIDGDGKSLLHIACSMGNYYTVNKLVSKQAKVNAVDKENRSALYIAAENGFEDICKCLLNEENGKNTADIHLSSKSGKSPLYAASENGHVNVVSFLLSKAANVRQETCRGKIALYAAAEKQFVNIVKEILPYTQEKDLFKLTHYGTTAMFIASKQPNKTVKKMLVAFCTKQKIKKNKNIAKNNYNDESPPNIKDNNDNEWLNILDDGQSQGHRLRTPKFAEQFESFQELKQKRKRNQTVSTKTNAFLERMTNILQIEKEEIEEKDISVPRVMDNNYHHRKRKRQKSVSLELKEDESQSQSQSHSHSHTQKLQHKQQKTVFDYDRLFRGKLRNKLQITNDDENDAKSDEEKIKKWKGFSDRFTNRNLGNNNNINHNKEDPDDILTQEENDKLEKEKERLSREAASKFLQRQKDKIMEAQKKAKERINRHKNKDILERKRLSKKREEARILAMKVAEKIAQRQHNEDNMKSLSLDLPVIARNNVNINDENRSELNLFDKLRKKGISNENFKNEEELTLNSHRSLTVLDKYKKAKKRSLQVTGRILNVLSDRTSKSSNGYIESYEINEDEYNEDYLFEDEICFLHPLSKKKKKKLRRNRLEQAYGIKSSTNNKKKKKIIAASVTNKNGTVLNGLLQIATINPQNRTIY